MLEDTHVTGVTVHSIERTGLSYKLKRKGGVYRHVTNAQKVYCKLNPQPFRLLRHRLS